MRITVAKTAGFCFGVDRAVKMADDLLAAGRKVATLGELIHNPVVTGSLAARGARVIERPEEAEPDEVVVIRSHGVGPEVYRVLEARGIQIADATCPNVARIHRLVREASAAGRGVLVIGRADHPEVRAICGRCDGARVAADAQELEILLNSEPDLREKPLTVVVQTTQTEENLRRCEFLIKKW